MAYSEKFNEDQIWFLEKTDTVDPHFRELFEKCKKKKEQMNINGI